MTPFIMYICPICDNPNLDQDPLERKFNICPICGVEFGVDDFEISHEELRKAYQEAGYPDWRKESEVPGFFGGVKWLDEKFGETGFNNSAAKIDYFKNK